LLAANRQAVSGIATAAAPAFILTLNPLPFADLLGLTLHLAGDDVLLQPEHVSREGRGI
jgi:hypothetical protein